MHYLLGVAHASVARRVMLDSALKRADEFMAVADKIIDCREKSDFYPLTRIIQGERVILKRLSDFIWVSNMHL